MNDQQAEELLELQRQALKEQKAIRADQRNGFGCLILFIALLTLLAFGASIQ